MSGNEAFSSLVNKGQGLSTKSAEASLITLERSQKLDLLIHLISNLRQSLVICGPNGIGKTKLLDELKIRKNDAWPMLNIQATSSLSFESFQDQLTRFLLQFNAEFKGHDLASVLSILGQQGQKVVVIVDNAGQIVPGLVNALLQYASTNLCLRFVFSLTHDELHIKNSSDAAIDDCHYIEIPPLTEKQCGLFLQNLSGQPGAVVSFNTINERMVERLYRETHGIPGEIVATLPKLSNYVSGGSDKWKMGVAIIVVFASAMGVKHFIFDEPEPKRFEEVIKTPLVLKQPELVEISAPVVGLVALSDEDKNSDEVLSSNINKDFSTQIIENTTIENEVSPNDSVAERNEAQAAVQYLERIESKELINEEADKKPDDKVNKKAEQIVIVENKENDNPVQFPVSSEIKTTGKVVKKETKKNEIVEHYGDRQWVLTQPEKNYSLQLMVLSTHKSVLGFLEKNKNLNDLLKYFRVSKKGKRKYILIYGSFENKTLAQKKMKSLPILYRKAWVRRFMDIQTDINNSN